MSTDSLNLTGKEYSLQVSDKHLKDISRSFCSKWRDLPPYLGLERNVVNDVERDFKTEGERRSGFLSIWKERKGSGATYKALVGALLEIKCVNEAGGVCKLLKTHDDLQAQSSLATVTPVTNAQTAISPKTTVSPQSSAARDTSASSSVDLSVTTISGSSIIPIACYKYTINMYCVCREAGIIPAFENRISFRRGDGKIIGQFEISE